MASTPEHRGESVRITWLRGKAKQSTTFSGPYEARMKLVLAAKDLVEARGHDITRDEVYAALLGPAATTPGELVPTFKQWAAQWLQQLRADDQVTPYVLKQYERYVTLRAVPYFGHKRLTEITRDDIKVWVAALRSTRVTFGNKNRRTGNRLLSANTINKQFMIVASCLGAAVPTWIPANPAASLPGQRKSLLGLPVIGPAKGMFLSADEVAAILAQCPPHVHDLAYVASRTGMRIGELFALDVQHVVFPRAGGATVLVRRSLKEDGTIGKPKTPASERDIPVLGRAADILAARVKGRRPSALLFTSPRGCVWNHRNFRERHWYRAVARAQRCPTHPPTAGVTAKGNPRLPRNSEVSTCGCPGVLAADRRPTPHDLRHTHASVLIAKGWHFKKIQRRLGHARFQTTMDVYGHLVDLGNEAELRGLEDFFDPQAVTRRPGRPGSALRRARHVHARTVVVRR